MDPNLIIVLLGTMTITSYQPIPAQTKPECKDRFHCTTSIDDGITQFGAAVSQDLLRSGKVCYGDGLIIEGFSNIRVVNDTMNKRHKNHVDLLVFSYLDEKKIGVQHRKVWVIHPKGEPSCSINHIPQRKIHPTAATVKVDGTILSDTTVHSGLK